MITTNRLQIQFNIGAIERDFVFIRLSRKTKENKWLGASQLDSLFGKEFMAVATLFIDNKYAYAMFKKITNKKTVDIYTLISKIRDSKLFDDDTAITKVIPIDNKDRTDGYIRGAWLVQILFNYLASSTSRHKKCQFCNLTGSLLVVFQSPHKKGHLDIAKIKIDAKDEDWFLNVSIVRYRSLSDINIELARIKDPRRKDQLEKALKKPYYRFEGTTSTYTFRRHLPSDGELDINSTYVECGKTNEKASLPFLEFGSVEAFNKSRAGIFYNIFNLAKKDLSEYIAIDLLGRDAIDYCELKNSLIKDPKQMNLILADQKIHIVDKVDTEESRAIIDSSKEIIMKEYYLPSKIITVGNDDKPNKLNIRIIHEKSYYIKNNIADEYKRSDLSINRQNITIESLKFQTKAIKNIIETSVKELLIKKDITDLKFSLFEWDKLGLSGTWTFAAWDEDEENVIFMEILHDGQFSFSRRSQDCDLFNISQFDAYLEYMSYKKSDTKESATYDEDDVNQKRKKKPNLEGLVISNEGDINQIFLTQEITLPDLERIHTLLSEREVSFPEEISTGYALWGIVQQFLKTHSVSSQQGFNSFLDELKEFGSNPIDKNEFHKLIGKHLSKSGKAIGKDPAQLRDYFLKMYGVRFIFPKDNRSKEETFDATVDIKYFGETENEAYYFVGCSKASIQSSFKDSCHLRKIVAVGKDSKLVFSQLLATMDVDFVRTGQSTVIPFPFKYIREYIEMNKVNQ
jgi:hypothetical protein